jgi:hypothetical protein
MRKLDSTSYHKFLPAGQVEKERGVGCPRPSLLTLVVTGATRKFVLAVVAVVLNVLIVRYKR